MYRYAGISLLGVPAYGVRAACCRFWTWYAVRRCRPAFVAPRHSTAATSCALDTLREIQKPKPLPAHKTLETPNLQKCCSEMRPPLSSRHFSHCPTTPLL